MKRIKWLISELVKILSSKDSFFSKKRLESAIAFAIGQVGMVFFLFKKYDTIDMYEFLMWAALEFTLAGYIMNVIEKGKSSSTTSKVEVNEEGKDSSMKVTTEVIGDPTEVIK